MGMPARIVIDQFNDASDINYVKRIAERYGLNSNSIEIVRRTADTQPVPVRKDDVFVAYNWWAAINLHGLISQQQTYFGLVKRKPMLYIVQDYEPGFYPMSSTHMLARAAFDGNGRTFGIFNSSELHAYFRAQGHAYDREFVIPLRMSKNLKAARRQDVASKGRRILVYGRPRVARNCFPAVVAGLRAFASAYEQFADWSIEFAGEAHATIDLGKGKKLVSLGKLSIEEYARTLESTAVGLSLMASPHPSYPPLEMAHFGVRTITNGYTFKDLSKVHENITSVENIMPNTIASALAAQCQVFLADQQAGWRAKSMLPDYFSNENYPFTERPDRGDHGRRTILMTCMLVATLISRVAVIGRQLYWQLKSFLRSVKSKNVCHSCATSSN